MNAKEYFLQARYIDKLIDVKLRQVEQLKETATRTTTTLSDMPRGGSPDQHPMETTIAKLIDLDQEINEDIDRLVDLKRAIKMRICELPTAEQRLLMEMRYLSCQSWQDIITALDRSEATVHRMHERSLKFFENIEK